VQKPYHDLTGHGRALRLRRLALNALERYDLDVTHVRLITNEFNGIFRVDTARRDRYILRVTLPEGGHDLDAVRGEMARLNALSHETDLCVPRPLAARNGQLIVEAESAGVPQPRFCAIFSWVPGTNLADRLTPDNVRKLGEMSARLHAHAATFQPPPGFIALRFDKVFPFPEPVILFQDECRHLFPPERRAVYERAIAWAQEAIDRLRACGEPMRIIHGDLHQWNVRVYRGMLSPIDFEDLMWGWPVQDIATTLYDLGPNDVGLRAAFRLGYMRRSPWPERYPGEIDAFIAARGVGLVNYILQDPDPDWQAQVPDLVERAEGRLRALLQSRR
jgi:Ser/Thr protein kinase RdoA (MazF antagonist)